MLKNDSTFSNDWEYVTALTAGLAHEIKNPLSTINMNLQLLQEEWADPKTPKESRIGRKLQTVQREVQRLAHTLDDFLRFVRSEPLKLEATDTYPLDITCQMLITEEDMEVYRQTLAQQEEKQAEMSTMVQFINDGTKNT